MLLLSTLEVSTFLVEFSFYEFSEFLFHLLAESQQKRLVQSLECALMQNE